MINQSIYQSLDSKVKSSLKFVLMFTGSAEMLMADAVSKLAAKTPGKEAVAMEAYAKALRMVCYSFFVILFKKCILKYRCGKKEDKENVT